MALKLPRRSASAAAAFGGKADAEANAAATRARVLILIPIREFIGGDFVAGNVKILFRVIASLLLISVATLFVEGRY